jgi:hypothetical protein
VLAQVHIVLGALARSGDWAAISPDHGGTLLGALAEMDSNHWSQLFWSGCRTGAWWAVVGLIGSLTSQIFETGRTRLYHCRAPTSAPRWHPHQALGRPRLLIEFPPSQSPRRYKVLWSITTPVKSGQLGDSSRWSRDRSF